MSSQELHVSQRPADGADLPGGVGDEPAPSAVARAAPLSLPGPIHAIFGGVPRPTRLGVLNSSPYAYQKAVSLVPAASLTMAACACPTTPPSGPCAASRLAGTIGLSPARTKAATAPPPCTR